MEDFFIFLSAFLILSPLLIFINRGFYLIISIFLILLLISTRNFGPDYKTYYDFFNNPITSVDALFSGSIEPFWPPYMYSIKNLFDKPSVGFTLIGLISFLARYLSSRLLFKSNALLSLSLSVYIFNDFFNRDLGQIRNGLSSSLLGLAISYYIVNQKNNFYITSLFSILTHYQSIVLLGLLATLEKLKFSFFRLRFKNYLIFVLFILSIIFLIPLIINFLIYIPLIDQLAIKILHYMGEGYQVNRRGVPYFIFLSIFVSIISFWNRKKYSNIEEKILNLQIFPPIIFLCFIAYPVLASRLSSTFTGLNNIFYPIILYYFTVKFKHKQKQTLYSISIILSILLGFFSLYKYNQTYLV